jgi:polyphosphate glucokinase
MARTILGVDVGGSSIKAGLVDVDGGRLEGEIVSTPTPQPSTPQATMKAIAQLAEQVSGSGGPVGLCFPSVVKNGRIRTAANIDKSWLGIDGAALAASALGRPVAFLNDADAAGLAEMRWGAGRGLAGPVVMLTLGTGIGSALFIDGRLFPNTELGHLEMRGMDAEKWASAHVRTALRLDWPAWCERLNEYLARMNALLWPDVFILGGAVTENFDEFAPLLECEAEIRPAHFSGQAGVIGAALAAALGAAQ